MQQRALIATAGLAVFALSGCATFDDHTAAARVGEAELTYDEVVEIVADAPGGADDANVVREVTSLFVANELVRSDLQTLGVELTDVDTSELTGVDALGTEFSTSVATWQNLPVEQLADDEVATFYSSGSSGLVCTSHILVETEAEAEAVIAELEAGRSFAEVAVETSLDPGSGANGGRLGCQAAEEFETTFVPEFVEGARGLEIDEISAPVRSEFGFHVITVASFDQLEAAEVLELRVRHFEERYDIYVDPAIGAWTPNAGIIPLG